MFFVLVLSSKGFLVPFVYERCVLTLKRTATLDLYLIGNVHVRKFRPVQSLEVFIDLWYISVYSAEYGFVIVFISEANSCPSKKLCSSVIYFGEFDVRTHYQYRFLIRSKWETLRNKCVLPIHIIIRSTCRMLRHEVVSIIYYSECYMNIHTMERSRRFPMRSIA